MFCHHPRVTFQCISRAKHTLQNFKPFLSLKLSPRFLKVLKRDTITPNPLIRHNKACREFYTVSHMTVLCSIITNKSNKTTNTKNLSNLRTCGLCLLLTVTPNASNNKINLKSNRDKITWSRTTTLL